MGELIDKCIKRMAEKRSLEPIDRAIPESKTYTVYSTLTDSFIGGNNFSVYDGVLVYWDGDHDRRVLIVIDRMHPYLKKKLLAVGEREGHITFLWKEEIPYEYRDNPQVDPEGTDEWGSTSFYVKGE